MSLIRTMSTIARRRISLECVFTYLSCVFGAGPYRCCKIFYTILCFAFVIICMQALNVSLIPMTSAMFPSDCKSSRKRVMLYPISVYCMTMTRLPISSYHHPRCATKFPHIMADDSVSIHRVLCRSLFSFRQECPARRLWSSWTVNARKRKTSGYFTWIFFFNILNWISIFSPIFLKGQTRNNGVNCHVFK